MQEEKNRTPQTTSLPLLAIFFMLSGLVIGFLTAMKIYQKPSQEQIATNSPTVSSTPLQQNKQCQLYGSGEEGKYLYVYIVKSGDTLLSLAKTQLGDSSRVNEVITLNKEKYPTLSLENSFIETGWKLLLPPKSYGVTNGRIKVIHGNLHKSFYGWWVFNARNANYIADLTSKDLEKYSHLNLAAGDCITVVYQTDIVDRKDKRPASPDEAFDMNNKSYDYKVFEIFKQ